MRLTQHDTRISRVYGAYIAVGMIAYFWVSYLTGLIHVVGLHLLNFVIVPIGVYHAMKHFMRTHKGHLGYFHALTAGIASSVIGISTFAVFLFFVFTVDDTLYQLVLKNAPMGVHPSVFVATAAVWFEGMFSGFMAAFFLINTVDTNN